MARRNLIQRTFDEFGAAAGMAKKSGSWHLAGDEVIALTNLQKSQYGPSYYVTQGWWLPGVADGEPRIETCHITARIEHLVDADATEIAALLDIESDLGEDERRGRLGGLLNEGLLPIIETGLTLDGLRALNAQGRLRNAGVRVEAQQRLAA